MDTDALLWNRLVDSLVAAGTVRTPRIIEAFRALPRSRFVPPELRRAAVTVDAPLAIGYGQTVSQPTTVATMLELVHPTAGERVFDIGTGSGWQAALLAFLVAPTGRVVTIERIPELAARAQEALAAAGVKGVRSLVGDASRKVPEPGRYDVVVSAASSPTVPSPWRQALKSGGRLLHPIEGLGLRLLTKDSRGRTTVQDYPGYVFVPLVSGEA